MKEKEVQTVNSTMEIYRRLEDLPVIERGALTIGKFDSMHKGHRKVLETTFHKATEENRKFIVMSFTNHPFDILKPGNSPNHLSDEKFKINYLQEIGCDILILVDFSTDIMETSREDFLLYLTKHIKDLHLILGYDFKFGAGNKGDVKYLEEYCSKLKNLQLTIVEKVEEDGVKLSSSLIRKLLREGKVKKANDFLNREYYIEATIIQGDKLGRAIGYPTINMYVEDMEYPKKGVYLSRVEIDEVNSHKTYHGYGMTYVGSRLVDGYKKQRSLIETHIFDFNKEVYGKNARIYFLYRIRDVMKFDSFESLKKQLNKDSKECKKLLEEKWL
jgi:riboflavin kinase / FMN adenylyltransferase